MADVTAFVKALQVPTLTVPRWRWSPLRLFLGPTKTYRGRILSHLQWLPFQEDIADLFRRRDEGEDVIAPMHEFYRRYLKAIGIPPRVVLALPTGAVRDVLADFLALQKAAVTGPTSTSGSNSPPKEDGGPRATQDGRHVPVE